MNDVLLTDRRLTVLRALDKLDRLGAVGVFLLLTCGRMDKSGDFCEGAGLSVVSAVFLLLSCNVDIRIACIHPETGCGIVDIGEMRIVIHGD